MRPYLYLAVIAALAILTTLRVMEPVSPEEPIRVIDGDTLAQGEARYRIENIDTPETGHRAECDFERELADRATRRMQEFVSQGVTIHPTGRTDRFDREIVRVRQNGRDVGEMMVEEGLAIEWQGRQGDWCRMSP